MNSASDQSQTVLHATAGARLAEAAAVAAARIPLSGLRSATRGRRPVARARQTAMYLSHVAFGLSLTRVGICFGRDRTTVRHACALIEDRRDDPGLELGLTALEAALLATMTKLRGQSAEIGR